MENNKLDLISDLPFEILTHIISFLPLKEAVRSTSSLSTLWRQLLAPQTVHLEFETSNFQQVLGKFLSSYICPERWKLSFLASETEEDCSAKEDVGVVVMAAKGVEKELHLHFLIKSGKEKTASHGFVLKLQQSVFSLQSVQSRSSFSSLKTLHLRSVNRQVVGLVSDLFACCRRLENLKLEKCEGLQDLNVEGCDSLQSLEILDCEDFVSITVCAPNLESFSYRGVLPWMRLESTSDLVDANLDLRNGEGGNEFDCEDVLCLLASLKEVQILTISGWLLEWMCTAGVIFGRLEFQFNKLRELYWFGSSMDRAKRDSLACFLNMCPLLEKLFVQMDDRFSAIPCPFFHQHWHEPHLWMDYEMVKSNTSQLKHLKTFEFLGFSGEEDELLLMELLLKKSVVLETMSVT